MGFNSAFKGLKVGLMLITMGLLSLMRLRGGGLGGGSSFTGDPGRCVQIVSGYGHLSP